MNEAETDVLNPWAEQVASEVRSLLDQTPQQWLDAISGICTSCGRYDDVLTPSGTCVTCWCKALESAEGITYRYFVTEGSGEEREVTKAEWVAMERRAGFVNTLGHPEEPGTGGFSTTSHGGISGRIETVRDRPHGPETSL